MTLKIPVSNHYFFFSKRPFVNISVTEAFQPISEKYADPLLA